MAEYNLTMSLYVPRVYHNTQSLGYREVQRQKIKGKIFVYFDPDSGASEPEISALDIVNTTHKINGARVTYGDADATEIMWRYIGSNRSGVFKKAQVKFSLDLDPSYNIGADEPDNALIIQISGHGASDKTIKGSVTGQIGCGCTEHGHLSPTRRIDGNPSDITPLDGTFVMTRIGKSPAFILQ
jgi:hypothetical protein